MQLLSKYGDIDNLVFSSARQEEMKHLHDYKIITLTHKHAPLKELGKLVWPQEGLQEQLEALKQRMGYSELLYLATCNRIMFLFLSTESFENKKDHLLHFFGENYPDYTEQDLDSLVDLARLYTGKAAVRHLFEVSASIDSLVVGEREILRQLRSSYEQQRAWGLTGDAIRLAMRFTVESSKRIYTNTRIGEKPVSVVSLAVQELLKLQPKKQARVLLIGAGQTNNLLIKLLKKKGFQNFTIFNRSLANAQLLAKQCQGEAYTLDELSSYQKGFDILVACTASTEPVLYAENYKRLLAGEEQSSKILIDLSIPHNIDKSVHELYPEHHSISIEDLQLLAHANLSFRQQEVESARQLIEEDVAQFEITQKARQMELSLRAVPEQVRAVKQHALDNLFREELEQLDEQSRALLEKIVGYMEKRCIAIPIQAAREHIAAQQEKSSKSSALL